MLSPNPKISSSPSTRIHPLMVTFDVRYRYIVQASNTQLAHTATRDSRFILYCQTSSRFKLSRNCQSRNSRDREQNTRDREGRVAPDPLITSNYRRLINYGNAICLHSQRPMASHGNCATPGVFDPFPENLPYCRCSKGALDFPQMGCVSLSN